MATETTHRDGPATPSARCCTEATHVAAAERAARMTSDHAHQCWSRLVTAIETNTGVEEARHDLIVATAQLSYAWAVYHCTAVDADEDGD